MTDTFEGMPAPDPAPAPDPTLTLKEAPYGVKEDGTPRAKPGRPKGSTNGRKRSPAPPRRRTSSPASSSSKPAGKDYRKPLLGLISLAVVPLAPRYPADAWAIGQYAPALVDGVNELAKSNPQVAAALEWATAASPYAAIVTPLVGLTIQLMHNHGVFGEKTAEQLGAVPKSQLLAALQERGEELAGQQDSSEDTVVLNHQAPAYA